MNVIIEANVEIMTRLIIASERDSEETDSGIWHNFVRYSHTGGTHSSEPLYIGLSLVQLSISSQLSPDRLLFSLPEHC